MYDGKYFQFCEEYSVRWRDIISTMEGYHQYNEGILQVLWRYTVSNRRIFSAFKGYHQYIRGIPSVQWRVFSTLKLPPSY